MAGTLTATTIQNDTSSPPTFRNNSVEIGTLCRAWVNFNGQGTVAIRASFNVSSITDNGTGNYTINFTTALPDSNFAANITCDGGNAYIGTTYGMLTTSVSIATWTDASAFFDNARISVSVFR
jgi:hypothetical protein